MILVTGATGTVGSQVVQQLVAGGARVRVLARNPQKAATLFDGAGKSAGSIEVVQGDLTEPATLGPALVGVRKAFVLAVGFGQLAELEGNVYTAAKHAGVEHVVKLSTAAIGMTPEVAIGRWHRLSEERLHSSGLPYTMVRPGNFASNSLRWAPMIKAQGAVFAPHGDGKSTPIDPYDIAAVAVAALLSADKKHHGKVYSISGPEALTVGEQVAQLGAVLGKPLRYVEVPEAGARAGMLSAGIPEILVDAVLELTRTMRSGQGATIEPTIQALLGRPPRTFTQWARENIAAFV